jgi:hypothetical protein
VTIPIPRFSSRLTSFTAADKQVYTWKVIGIPDSTHSSLSATSIKVIADSDFGSHNGIGIFTLADRMPDFASQIVQNPIVQNNPVDQFSDRDNDMFPDWLEKAFGTSPDDPGSYPNFTLDSDQDGYADFLELFSGSKVDNAESKPQDTDPADLIPDMLQKRPEWRPELAFDDDKDGFPNQIEMIFRTDPRNNTSKPSISIKASAPVGTYFGGIRLNGQNWKRINFSLLSDTTGDFVFVDTTELEGIARNGVDLSVNCIWNNGEWVFYLGIVNGPNSGKFIKVRFHREGNNLRGPIDLADSKNGGGPYIGEFFASMDSIKDFNNLTNGLTNPIIINQNPQGTVNIGPPPADQVKRPDSGSVDMKLVMTFTVGEIPNVKVVLPDDSIFSDKPFWAPGQFPSLGFNLPGSTKQYRIEGNYHKINNPNGDTLVLVGIIEFNQNNPSGGTFRQAFNFVVFTTGITDLRKPGGTWTGWYRKPFASTNIQQGPKPYIGSKDSVNAALAKTQNAGIIMETQQIVTFSSAVQQPNTNVWTVKVDTSTFFIMEKVGDFLNVMIKVIDGKQYIVLSKGTSVQQNPNTNPQPPVFFTGDSSVVVAALVQAHDTVKIATQIPIIIMINPQSLHREISPQTGMPGRWVANDLKNANHQIVFLANPANPQQLQIEQNRPVVNDVVIQQNPNTDPQNPITNPLQPVFFKGDSSMIIAALALVNDSVKIAAPNPIFIRVNRVTVRREASPQPDQPGRWIADDIVNVNHKIAFLANPANPLQLLLEQNKPVVHDVVMQPAGIVPFTGDTSLVRTVLNSSNNQIVLVGNSNPITINPASLVKMVDPQNPDNVGYIVSAAGNPIDRFLFLGQEQNPSMLKMNGQTPVCSKVTI